MELVGFWEDLVLGLRILGLMFVYILEECVVDFRELVVLSLEFVLCEIFSVSVDLFLVSGID